MYSRANNNKPSKAMKKLTRLALLVAALGLLVATPAALARDKVPAEAKAKKAKTTAVKKRAVGEQVEVATGSHIKQKATKTGLSTDTTSPTIVIDQTTIRRTGANDLNGVFRGVPLH